MPERRGALIVTGGGRGIGAAIAKLAGRQGYPVIVNFERNEKAAARTVEEITATGGEARTIRANVGREEDVLRLFEAADREFGEVRALVNNAGITGGFARVENVAAAAILETLQVNVLGTILCCREAVRRMSTARGNHGGAIVNVSSLAARTGGAGEWVHYAASKGAINSFTVGLAREVAAEGIRVNAVAPGLIATDLHASSGGGSDRLERLQGTVPMRRPGTADEIAAGVLWLLSTAASYTTGTILEIGGGR